MWKRILKKSQNLRERDRKRNREWERERRMVRERGIEREKKRRIVRERDREMDSEWKRETEGEKKVQRDRKVTESLRELSLVFLSNILENRILIFSNLAISQTLKLLLNTHLPPHELDPELLFIPVNIQGLKKYNVWGCKVKICSMYMHKFLPSIGKKPTRDRNLCVFQYIT